MLQKFRAKATTSRLVKAPAVDRFILQVPVCALAREAGIFRNRTDEGRSLVRKKELNPGISAGLATFSPAGVGKLTEWLFAG